MSERKEELSGLGFPIGEPGRRNKRAVQATFLKAGIPVSLPTIWVMRRDEQGEVITERARSLRALEANDASKKNNSYLTIAQAGLDCRSYQATRVPHRLQSVGFTENIAQTSGFDEIIVRRSLRAMRTDLVLFQAEIHNKELDEALVETAGKYVSDYQHPESQSSQAQRHLWTQWDNRTIESYYREMYEIFGARSLGTWAPYEMEVMRVFYEQQKGSNLLTPFDRMVLGAFSRGASEEDLSSQIRTDTGIKLDEWVLPIHRHAVLQGFSPQQKVQ